MRDKTRTGVDLKVYVNTIREILKDEGIRLSFLPDDTLTQMNRQISNDFRANLPIIKSARKALRKLK